jgi:hypothetical protein
MASEIFNAEINALMDKFFEAPVPKPPAAQESNDDDEEVRELGVTPC